MPLKDIFKHHHHHLHRGDKEKGDRRGSADDSPPQSPASAAPPPIVTSAPPVPEFKFIRSDTNSHDVIHPPTGFSTHDHSATSADAYNDLGGPLSPTSPTSPTSGGRARSSSNASRFRETLSFSHRRNRSSSNHSTHIPADLPMISDSAVDKETQWEKRATILVGTPVVPVHPALPAEDPQADENIQEAIRLHEEGELEKSTAMFGRLADADNPLSQVLYGLALRHGWGCTMNKSKGLEYLRKAASNSAAVEQEALKAGIKKGGSAKGELVLAIYELGNSYRNGWGVTKDPAAAREYYETAANLGDPDAQNEVAWCYLEGFGCKKDRFKAAKFYRMAEKQGNKTLGNSWYVTRTLPTGNGID
ncbi:hypothetical protein BZA05DRAFT_330964 [Tricharina praecox]|uniref:uncharacterized protein n=1 Tax=Tricharina praecox TaxID=43433 RepID=UPI002220DF11|nr:uncharacterized protein BZA05DRAFT_330964 [Tricharina praecox]KAI5857598.1 hypothetical protein BZA05DRAFT_330964 [Tricharina praecox]